MEEGDKDRKLTQEEIDELVARLLKEKEEKEKGKDGDGADKSED